MAAAVEFPDVKCCLLFALLLISLCLKGGASRSVSKEQVDDDLEIERKLNTLNKLPIKTIHTEWGDVLDCVDINKQPAFDHPLLKHHKIQMKPSFPLKDYEKLPSTKSDEQSSIFMLPDEDCPEGTVPILRTHKESSIKDVTQTRSDGHSLAGVRYNVTGETFYGAAARLDAYNPKLTSEDQFSSAEISVENGPDGIRVGWTVNPNIYGDHNTRVFTIWTSDNYQKTGCYDAARCPGFFQVHPSIHPGVRINNTSVVGGAQSMVDFELYQAGDNTGDWWLVLNGINVGYWPKDLFGSLGGGCDQIYWGGNVKNSAGGLSPEMGSGHFPLEHNFGKACDFEHLQYVNKTFFVQNPKEDYVREVAECSGFCGGRYGVDYYGFQKEGDFGHTFLFGGPGGPDVPNDGV